MNHVQTNRPHYGHNRNYNHGYNAHTNHYNTNHYNTKHYHSFQGHQEESSHPEHPVRNVFFGIFSTFFVLAFNYLWVRQLFRFSYTWLLISIAATILTIALIGAVVSFKRSHANYFAHRRNCKRKMRY